MTNIFSLQDRLLKISESPKIATLDDKCRDELAKVSITFGELSDYLETVDSPGATNLKTSDISLYQAKIQTLLESIEKSLSFIELKL